MEEKKTKSIINIERRMEEIPPDSLRYEVLKSARMFKTSWIQLGQLLYTVWKDKLYKDWGYTEFDSYTSREIGIRGQTSLKLLRSYSFLEKTEPHYIKRDSDETRVDVQVPSYESVDILRRASNNKDIPREDYNRIRRYVLEEGKDAKTVKKDLTEVIKRNEELEPEEAYRKKSTARIKRFLGMLKALEKELRVSKALPDRIVSETRKLIAMIEEEAV